MSLPVCDSHMRIDLSLDAEARIGTGPVWPSSSLCLSSSASPSGASFSSSASIFSSVSLATVSLIVSRD